MYKIIGGDGKEYGPVNADELRRWIAEGRLNRQSRVKPEGLTDWLLLGAVPEFADALRAQERPQIVAATGQPMPPASTEAWKAEILSRQAHLRIGHCLASSWRLVTANFGLILGATALYWLIQSVCERIPVINLFYWVFDGVFYGGLCLVFLKRIRGQPARIADLFFGFGTAFVQLLLVGLVSVLLSSIGMCCLFLPGIYLVVAWTFGVPLVADRRLEFWTAMELSRKMVTRVWFEVFALLIIPLLPVFLVAGFGWAKTFSTLLPVLQEMIRAGAPDPTRFIAVGTQAAHAWMPFWIATKLLLLLILPFAIGARMFAYEDLFGTRSAPNT
jgi:hypothetical protein